MEGLTVGEPSDGGFYGESWHTMDGQWALAPGDLGRTCECLWGATSGDV